MPEAIAKVDIVNLPPILKFIGRIGNLEERCVDLTPYEIQGALREALEELEREVIRRETEDESDR